MAIDHLSLHVPEAKFQQCLEFYLAALKPLGYEIRQQFGEAVVGMASKLDMGFVAPADFWVIADKDGGSYASHLAFRAPGMPSKDYISFICGANRHKTVQVLTLFMMQPPRPGGRIMANRVCEQCTMATIMGLL